MGYKKQEEIWESRWVDKDWTYRDYMADHPKKRMRDVLQEYADLRDIGILDIGTGEGFWLRYYQEQGATTVTGIDITRSSVTAARQNAPQASIVQADTRLLPFADHSFDLVLSYGVVEHFPETLLALEEHVRVVKPGGKVIVAIPNRFGFRHAERWNRNPPYGGFMHKHYSPDEAYNLFHLVRLNDIQITGIDARLPRRKGWRWFNALMKRTLDPLMLWMERSFGWVRFHSNLNVIIGTKPRSPERDL